jgi:hypothetical protein
MSHLSWRWKENRVWQEIYLEQLRHTETLPDRAGFNEPNFQGRNETSVLFLEQTQDSPSDKRISNRRKKDRLPWIMLRLAFLAAGIAGWLWVSLSQFGVHR